MVSNTLAERGTMPAILMPKIRYLKPDFFLDEHITELEPIHRIAFAGLWCYADREGRLEDSPKRLKAEILPYDKVDMNTVLSTLHPRFILRYDFNGKKYIQINNFLKHQRPHPHEAASVVPKCNDKKLLAIKCHAYKGIDTDSNRIDTDGIGMGNVTSHGGVCAFTPPTLEEVKAFCLERGKNIDAQYFHDYWTSVGWMRGRFKMKDWKATMRNWEEKQNGTSQGNRQGRIIGAAKPTPGKYSGLGETINTD